MSNPWDLGNLLMMFDESMQKIIHHLENGNPDRALWRAKETHRSLSKIMDHCVGDMSKAIEKKL